MGRCDEALDAMTDLAHAFKTREYQEYLQRYERSMDNTGSHVNAETGEIEANEPGNSTQLVRASMVNVEVAEPVWVSDDVVTLVEHAASEPSFHPEAIEAHDLWTPHAFALLEKPLRILDIHGLMLAYRAISWSLTKMRDGEGVLVCLWSHILDVDGYRPQPGYEVAQPAPDFTEEEDPELVKLELIGGSPLYLAHVGVIPFGEVRAMIDQPTLASSLAQFECLWRLAKEQIIVQAQERASRHARKRAARVRPLEDVTVLRLRRVKYIERGENGSGREQTIRTIVNGFWRDEHYPSLGPARLADGSSNPASHKQKWIHEFVRGPADAPLVLKRRGTQFDR